MSRTAILNFVAAERGGALTYAMNFCRQLARVDMADRFIVLLCSDGYEAGAPWPEAAHIDYRVYGWPKRSFIHRLWFDQHNSMYLSDES